MRKFFAVIITILCFIALFSLSNELGQVVALDDYYASTQNLSGTELLNELAKISQKNHTYYTTYAELRQKNALSDPDPNNSSNLLDFYSQISVKAAWDSGATWNREHVWPQSLSGGLYGETGAGADIHHIRPTISSINSSRGNKLFTDFDMISASGSPKTYNNQIIAYTGGNYWEPLDNVKGDTARIILYLYMHYSKEVSANSSFSYAGNLKIQNVIYSDTGLDGALEILATWNKLDPVDTYEANRNDYCASVTHVRNPFIDHPEFVDQIWATSASDTTYSVTYDCGDATFDYNDNTEYKLGSKINEPSKEPVLQGYRFEGWYSDSNYSTKWDFNNSTIKGNLVLYAKFTEVIVENTFADVFKRTDIKSQLTFNVEISETVGTTVTNSIAFTSPTQGAGSLSAADYNLAEYYDFDNSLFDVVYKKNGASYSYISSTNSQIRLYPANGNGSSIDITAKDGVTIKNVTFTLKEGKNPTVTISSDGKSAKIQNTVGASSGSSNQSRMTGFTITYEVNGASQIVSVADGSLKLKYCLDLTETQYNLYLLDSAGLKLFINNEEVDFYIYKANGKFMLMFEIEVTDLNKVYVPKFVFNGVEKTISGYSAKSLAQYYLNNLGNNTLVKQYMDCLTEIAG